jgi:hypothetical protein
MVQMMEAMSYKSLLDIQSYKLAVDLGPSRRTRQEIRNEVKQKTADLNWCEIGNALIHGDS